MPRPRKSLRPPGEPAAGPPALEQAIATFESGHGVPLSSMLDAKHPGASGTLSTLPSIIGGLARSGFSNPGAELARQWRNACAEADGQLAPFRGESKIHSRAWFGISGAGPEGFCIQAALRPQGWRLVHAHPLPGPEGPAQVECAAFLSALSPGDTSAAAWIEQGLFDVDEPMLGESGGIAGLTLLGVACSRANIELAESMLRLGANPHAPMPCGLRPIHCCAMAEKAYARDGDGHPWRSRAMDCSRLLLRWGADPRAPRADGSAAMGSLASLAKGSPIREALAACAERDALARCMGPPGAGAKESPRI